MEECGHGAEILAAYFDEHDPTTLLDYGDRLGNRALFKRLGYSIEAMRRDLSQIISAACQERVSAGISALDPDGPPGGRSNTRWGLRINVTVGDGGTRMIPRRELDELRGEWSLDIGVIEKDYVLGWLLAGVAQHVQPRRRRGSSKAGPACASATTRPSGSPRTSTSRSSTAARWNLRTCRASSPRSPTGCREESGIELVRSRAGPSGRRRNQRERQPPRGAIDYRGPQRHRAERTQGQA